MELIPGTPRGVSTSGVWLTNDRKFRIERLPNRRWRIRPEKRKASEFLAAHHLARIQFKSRADAAMWLSFALGGSGDVQVTQRRWVFKYIKSVAPAMLQP